MRVPSWDREEHAMNKTRFYFNFSPITGATLLALATVVIIVAVVSVVVPTRVNDLLENGLTKNNQGDYLGAIADYTKAIKMKPDYGLAYYKRGVAYIGMGEQANAYKDFAKAKDLGYSVPEAAWKLCEQAVLPQTTR